MGTEKRPVDESLLGRWIPVYGEMSDVAKSGEAPEELKNLYIEFDQSGPTTLNRVYGALGLDLAQLPDIDASMLTETAFVTEVGGVRILNMRVRLSADEEEEVYRFYRYAADDQFLQMWHVEEDLFRADGTLAEFDDPSQLHAFASERVNREGFFGEEFELFVRADATAPQSVTANIMYSRGDREYSNGNYTEALPWLTAAADHGNRPAHLKLATAFLQGKGVQRDLHQARRHLERWTSSPYLRESSPTQAKLVDHEIKRQAQGVPFSEIQCVDVNTFALTDEPVRFLTTPKELWGQIKYPDSARRAGVEGMVFVQLITRPSGTVAEAEVTRSIADQTKGITDQLNQEALRVARMALFAPSTHWGLPVCRRMSIPIKFDLSTAAQKAAPGQDVNAANTENAASTARGAIESIKASSRPSLVDQSTKVLILRNPGRESVRFRLVCASPQGRRKSFTVSLDPYGSTELGFMQGWEGNFTSGDVCTAFDRETSVWRVTF